jgi:PleD family two-component response regulator
MNEQQARVFAAVKDIFFSAKISAAAKRVGVPVRFVIDESPALQEGAGVRCLLLLDLNDASLRPLELIRRLKAKAPAQPVRIIGYLSHVQRDLMREAQEAGCDVVLPRSAFSQDLDQIIRQETGTPAV